MINAQVQKNINQQINEKMLNISQLLQQQNVYRSQILSQSQIIDNRRDKQELQQLRSKNAFYMEILLKLQTIMNVSNIKELLFAVQQMQLENNKLKSIAKNNSNVSQRNPTNSNNSCTSKHVSFDTQVQVSKQNTSKINLDTFIRNDSDASHSRKTSSTHLKTQRTYSDNNILHNSSKQHTQIENSIVHNNLTCDFLQQHNPESQPNTDAVQQPDQKKDISSITDILSSQIGDITFNKVDLSEEMIQHDIKNDQMLVHASSNFNAQDQKIQLGIKSKPDLNKLQQKNNITENTIQEELQIESQYHLPEITDPTTEEKLDDYKSIENSEGVGNKKDNDQDGLKSKLAQDKGTLEFDSYEHPELAIQFQPSKICFQRATNQQCQYQKLVIRNISYDNIELIGQISNGDLYEFLVDRQYYEKINIELAAQEYIEIFVVSRNTNDSNEECSLSFNWVDESGNHKQTINILHGA